MHSYICVALGAKRVSCKHEGFPHSDIYGLTLARQLPVAYRSRAASFIASSSLGIHHMLLNFLLGNLYAIALPRNGKPLFCLILLHEINPYNKFTCYPPKFLLTQKFWRVLPVHDLTYTELCLRRLKRPNTNVSPGQDSIFKRQSFCIRQRRIAPKGTKKPLFQADKKQGHVLALFSPL